MNSLDPFKGLLEDLGPPTPRSLERERTLKLECENRKDPNSFYLVFNVVQPPSINWAHNTSRHLGEQDVTFESYFLKIHPVWMPIHLGFASAAYSIAFKLWRERIDTLAVYTVNVPLRHEDGTYHWYNQVSFPSLVDANGRMLTHLNQYHRLCAYDQLVPNRPTLTIEDIWQRQFDQDFARGGNDALSKSLNPLLTPASHRVLQTYRGLTKNQGGKWISPAKKEVREALGLSPTAINKANVRIIQAVKGKFPDSVTRDIARFASFLNDLCGLP